MAVTNNPIPSFLRWEPWLQEAIKERTSPQIYIADLIAPPRVVTASKGAYDVMPITMKYKFVNTFLSYQDEAKTLSAERWESGMYKTRYRGIKDYKNAYQWAQAVQRGATWDERVRAASQAKFTLELHREILTRDKIYNDGIITNTVSLTDNAFVLKDGSTVDLTGHQVKQYTTTDWEFLLYAIWEKFVKFQSGWNISDMTLVIDEGAFKHLLRSNSLKTQVQLSRNEIGVLSQLMKADFIRQTGIKDVITTNCKVDTSKSSTDKTLAEIWPTDKALLTKIADGPMDEEPHLAKTFIWEEVGSSTANIFSYVDPKAEIKNEYYVAITQDGVVMPYSFNTDTLSIQTNIANSCTVIIEDLYGE